MFLRRVCQKGGFVGWRCWLGGGVFVGILALAWWTFATVKYSYVDPSTGLHLEIPRNWKIWRSERSLQYDLNPRSSIISQDSVWITINFVSPISSTNDLTQIGTLEEQVKRQIDRLNTHFFKLDEIYYMQPIVRIEDMVHETAMVTLAVPTIAIAEDSARNQTGQRDPDIFQIVDIYLINSDPRLYTVVEVYKGKSERLNTQADEIVRSIHFNTRVQP
ncbi:MAG: hypothetical protein WHX52_22805 [Anaerolineae bacterium]